MTLQIEKLAIKIFNWAQLSFVNLNHNMRPATNCWRRETIAIDRNWGCINWLHLMLLAPTQWGEQFNMVTGGTLFYYIRSAFKKIHITFMLTACKGVDRKLTTGAMRPPKRIIPAKMKMHVLRYCCKVASVCKIQSFKSLQFQSE